MVEFVTVKEQSELSRAALSKMRDGSCWGVHSTLEEMYQLQQDGKEFGNRFIAGLLVKEFPAVSATNGSCKKFLFIEVLPSQEMGSMCSLFTFGRLASSLEEEGKLLDKYILIRNPVKINNLSTKRHSQLSDGMQWQLMIGNGNEEKISELIINAKELWTTDQSFKRVRTQKNDVGVTKKRKISDSADAEAPWTPSTEQSDLTSMSTPMTMIPMSVISGMASNSERDDLSSQKAMIAELTRSHVMQRSKLNPSVCLEEKISSSCASDVSEKSYSPSEESNFNSASATNATTVVDLDSDSNSVLALTSSPILDAGDAVSSVSDMSPLVQEKRKAARVISDSMSSSNEEDSNAVKNAQPSEAVDSSDKPDSSRVFSSKMSESLNPNLLANVPRTDTNHSSGANSGSHSDTAESYATCLSRSHSPLNSKTKSSESSTINLEKDTETISRANVALAAPQSLSLPEDSSKSVQKSLVQYKYTLLKDAQVNKKLNIYGLVNKTIKEPTSTVNERKKHAMVSLADETCENFLLHIMCEKEIEIPSLQAGDVVRAHRMSVELFQNKLDGRVYKVQDMLIFKNSSEEDVEPWTAAKSFTFTEEDKLRVKALRKFFLDQRKLIKVNETSVLQDPGERRQILIETMALKNSNEDQEDLKKVEEWFNTQTYGVKRIENVSGPCIFHLFCRVIAVDAIENTQNVILQVEDGTELKIPSRKLRNKYSQKKSPCRYNARRSFLEVMVSDADEKIKRLERNTNVFLFGVEVKEDMQTLDGTTLYSASLCRGAKDSLLLSSSHPVIRFIQKHMATCSPSSSTKVVENKSPLKEQQLPIQQQEQRPVKRPDVNVVQEEDLMSEGSQLSDNSGMPHTVTQDDTASDSSSKNKEVEQNQTNHAPSTSRVTEEDLNKNNLDTSPPERGQKRSSSQITEESSQERKDGAGLRSSTNRKSSQLTIHNRRRPLVQFPVSERLKQRLSEVSAASANKKTVQENAKAEQNSWSNRKTRTKKTGDEESGLESSSNTTKSFPTQEDSAASSMMIDLTEETDESSFVTTTLVKKTPVSISYVLTHLQEKKLRVRCCLVGGFPSLNLPWYEYLLGHCSLCKSFFQHPGNCPEQRHHEGDKEIVIFFCPRCNPSSVLDLCFNFVLFLKDKAENHILTVRLNGYPAENFFGCTAKEFCVRLPFTKSSVETRWEALMQKVQASRTNPLVDMCIGHEDTKQGSEFYVYNTKLL